MNTKAEKSGVFGSLTELLYKAIELVGMLCLSGQVIIIAYAVVMRYIFNKSPSWAEEISRILMIWMSLLTISLAVKDDTHVRISFLDKLFPGKARLVRALMLHSLPTPA